MKRAAVFALISAVLAASVAASESGYVLDSNTAFYEGESFNYIIAPPSAFKLVVDQTPFHSFLIPCSSRSKRWL
ncbi:MAG: hypothetical protein KAU35_05540 [candidate division Zixibacteria bacterium]|nr:hypothetical protein [candidate division Zixibacteria bacterium]